MSPKQNQSYTPIQSLNHLIAGFTILSQNARFCHWNVIGPLFEDNHEFFGELYDYLSETTDIFAERIRALDAYPVSQLAQYLNTTSIHEYALPMSASEMQKNILKDLIHLSHEMEKFANGSDIDLVTQDIIISEKQVIDKKIWMLRAMLGK